MKPGTKPTPTEILRLHGTYRKDRHAARADAAPPEGQPVKPDLGDVESALWEQVVPGLISRRLVGSKDTAALQCLCELWGLYRASYVLAKVAPTDKEIRCAVTGYWAAFDRVAAKFGLTSADFAALKVPTEKSTQGLSARKRAQ